MTRDEGSAAVEFIAVVVALMLPIAYVVVAYTQIQSAKSGVIGAAQQAGRAYIQATSETYARFAAVRAATIAGRNHGLLITDADVRITCDATPCLRPGGELTIDVRSSAPIPYAPGLGRIPLQATQRVLVDAYRADPW